MTAVEATSTGVGLSSAEAAARLEAAGPNRLPVPAGVPVWRRLAAQMVHFFALMFWVAGALAFAAGLPQLGVAIFVVVVLNGVFSFAQEYRAERAAERLRDLLPRRVTVVRGGMHHDISAEELVRGDLVLLSSGDRISADLSALEVHALSVDTSQLTGESVPTSPESGAMLHAGSFVVEGEASAVVEATGAGTRLAGIAQLSRAGQRPRSPLEAELHRVVRVLAVVAITVGVVFFGASLLVGSPASDGFLFAVGVTVAVVPCGLLPTVTLSLAMGAQRMAGRRALVRRLEAVETLGSTTFICTDKTGTLTRNEMSVVQVWTPSGTAAIAGVGYEPEGSVDADPRTTEAVRSVAIAAVRCSTGHATQREGRWVAQGDPMEAALDVLARRLGIDVTGDGRRDPTTRRFPFDARRRRMSVLTQGCLYTKGAPDAVMPRCARASGAASALDSMAARGLRVLAVAARPRAADDDASASDDVERDLRLLGLVGLEDPPRPHAAESLAACRRAGISVAMVTGDHPATARAIAKEVGLVRGEERVLLGSELPDDDSELGALLDHDGIVVARVAPEEKLRIAQGLRGRGHVVAMTGDGVNDGPALQAADIGVAMGRSGTDVAREAADLVLLDDDFATIVAAVEQGRATFANIRRFLTYHLTDNVAELTPFVVWALSGGSFPLAIGVLQVLALDVGTDILPALALGAEPPGRHILDGRQRRWHLVDRPLLTRAFGILGPVEAFFEMTAFVVALVASGWRPGESFPTGTPLLAASGAAFTAVVFGQVANAFACRSTTRWPGRLGWTGNRLLLWAIAAELLMLVAFLFIEPLATLLDQAPPSWAGFAVALLAAPAVLAADAAHKAWRARARMAQ
jgi:magnesium-transporting ATPase (P-type)